MAKIQRVQGSRQLDPAAPAQVAQGAFTQEAQAQDQFGQQIQAVNEKLRQIRQSAQINEAAAAATVSLADIRSRAEKDPNPDNAHVYQAEIEKVRQNSSKTIEAGSEKFDFETRVSTDSKLAQIQVGSVFQAKQLDRNRASTQLLLDSLKERFMQEGNASLRGHHLSYAYEVLDKAVREGTWDATVAETMKKNLEKEWSENEYLLDVYGNPTKGIQPDLMKAKRSLELNTYGFSPSERQSRLTHIDSVIKNQVDEYQKANNSEAWVEVLTNKRSPDQTIEDMKNGKLNAEQGLKLYKYQTDPAEQKVDPTLDLISYNQIVDMRNSGKDANGNPVSAEQLNDLIIGMVDQRVLSPANGEELLKAGYSEIKTNDQSLEKIESDGIKAFAQKVVSPSADLFSESGEQKSKIANYEYLFHKRILMEKAKGERIQQIAAEIKQQIVFENDPSAHDVPGTVHASISASGKVTHWFDKKEKVTAKPTSKPTWTSIPVKSEDAPKPKEKK